MNFNGLQKKALVSVAVIVLAMLLYPPFRVQGYGTNSSIILETGYAWIFSLPERATVDVVTLLIQWIGVLIVGGIAIALLKDK